VNLGNNNLFKKRLEALGIARQVDAAMVVAETQRIIEENLPSGAHDNVQVISFNRSILKISTSSSAWAAEVQNILELIKNDQVKRIIFTSSNILN
jgi:hypothetical protein